MIMTEFGKPMLWFALSKQFLVIEDEMIYSLQVQHSSVMLDDRLAVYTQFDDLLTAVTERLDITERLLDKYRGNGNIEFIAARIKSIQVQLVVEMLFDILMDTRF